MPSQKETPSTSAVTATVPDTVATPHKTTAQSKVATGPKKEGAGKKEKKPSAVQHESKLPPKRAPLTRDAAATIGTGRRASAASATEAKPAPAQGGAPKAPASLNATADRTTAMRTNSYVNNVENSPNGDRKGKSTKATENTPSKRRTLEYLQADSHRTASHARMKRAAVVRRTDRPAPTAGVQQAPSVQSGPAGVPPPPATAALALATEREATPAPAAAATAVPEPTSQAAEPVTTDPVAEAVAEVDPEAAATGAADGGAPEEPAEAAAAGQTNAFNAESGYSFRTTDTQKATYEALSALMTSPLPELQEPAEVKTYEETSLEESLYTLIEQNDVIMVAGAFFGDEGKGKTVDAVSHHPKCTCIARTNSGENAGHTVYDKQGRKFVFNLAPSGLLTPGKKNYIGPECVLDPVSFMEKEVKQLIDAGISYHDTLFVGNCCIVTPYHKLLDLLGSAVNASTLKGMAPVHASKVTKRGIRLDHIFNDEETLRTRLAKDMDTYFGLLKVKGLSDADVVKRCEEENSDGVIRVPDYVVSFAKAEDKVGFLVDLYRSRVRENPAFPSRCDVIHELRTAVLRGEKVLLEGPQSYWLSNAREKFWGSTTSADTSAAGLLATSQLNFQQFRCLVINVHKAPASSRVGIGACPCSFVPQDYFSAQNIKTLRDLPPSMCTDFDAIQKLYFSEAYKNVDDASKFNGLAEPIEYTDSTGTYNIGVAMAVSSAIHHGECGAVTKKPRICGLFDCVLQHEVSAVQGPYLSISALDRGDDYDRVGITIAYIYYAPDGQEVDVNGKRYKNGDIIRAGDPVPGEAALFHCHPITKLVHGWKESPISAKTRAPNTPFPQGLNEFLSAVEHFGGCKVLSIGNGPNGEDIIYIRQ